MVQGSETKSFVVLIAELKTRSPHDTSRWSLNKKVEESDLSLQLSKFGEVESQDIQLLESTFDIYICLMIIVVI